MIDIAFRVLAVMLDLLSVPISDKGIEPPVIEQPQEATPQPADVDY